MLLGTTAAAATDLVRATAFVHPSSFQGCKGGLVSCLLSLPLSNVASPRSPAGLPSLTVGARPSDSVFPILPPRHEITKTMPSHEVSSELASWHFFFFSSHSLGNGHCDTFRQVEQCWTRDKTGFCAASFRFSRTPRRRTKLSSPRKVLPHALVYQRRWFPFMLF